MQHLKKQLIYFNKMNHPHLIIQQKMINSNQLNEMNEKNLNPKES